MPRPLHTYHAMPSAVHFHVDLPRSTSLSPSHILTLFLPFSFSLSLRSLPLTSHPKDGLLPGDEVDHLHLEDVPGKAQRCFAAIDCGVKVLKQFINLVALTTCRLSHAPPLVPAGVPAVLRQAAGGPSFSPLPPHHLSPVLQASQAAHYCR